MLNSIPYKYLYKRKGVPFGTPFLDFGTPPLL